MPDFGRLRAEQQQQRPINPKDIFKRLVKPDYMRDLLPGQRDVLETWFEARIESDNVVKINTGGGKTLVGLLMARSTMNEIGGRVLYLCPNKQLVKQTLTKAREVGIDAVAYISGQPIPALFLAGRAILVGSYQALFNGKSKFKLAGEPDFVRLSALILDDAHVEFSGLRNSYTVQVDGTKEATRDAYDQLIALLRPTFRGTGREYTLDDVLEGRDYSVLEVPYWQWEGVTGEVSEIVRSLDLIEYPLVREDLPNCHCLIARHSVSIVPIFPMVDKLPSFQHAQRRIFMSATLADDGVLRAMFGIPSVVLERTIASDSVASVAERMILIPDLKQELDKDKVRSIVDDLLVGLPAEKKGAAILTPSFDRARTWQPPATALDDPRVVEEKIELMQAKREFGPFAFASRYDGMDLDGDACRLLVIDGLPRGRSAYEDYRGSALPNSGEVSASYALRIEQGLGRAARGGGDWCVIVLLDGELAGWISTREHWAYMTSSTRAQIAIGENVSERITGIDDFVETMMSCINRDDDWKQYHQEKLVDYMDVQEEKRPSDSPITLERRAFDFAREGDYARAALVLREAVEANTIGIEYRAWFLQMAARYLWFSGDRPRSVEVQRRAYLSNHSLMRPQVAEDIYEASTGPEADQAQEILNLVASYRPGGLRARLTTIFRDLVHEATSNRFEMALKELGTSLGFVTERPDSGRRPRRGPDVLWLAHGNHAFILEAKNRKGVDSALTRDEHGQILNASEWFGTKYGGWSYQRIVVLPSATASESVDCGATVALDLNELNRLKDAVLRALDDISAIPTTAADRVPRAQAILEMHSLTPQRLSSYFQEFTRVQDREGEAVELPLE